MRRSQPPETLAEYVRRIRGNRSLKEIERLTALKGTRVPASYINRIENEVIKRPSAERLVAIARGFGVPEEEMLAVARGKPLSQHDVQEERLITMFRELPLGTKGDLLRITRALHREHAVKKISDAA